MLCPNCGPGHELSKVKMFGMRAKICIQNGGCGRWWTGPVTKGKMTFREHARFWITRLKKRIGL